MHQRKAPDDLLPKVFARLGLQQEPPPQELPAGALEMHGASLDELRGALSHQEWSVRVRAVLAFRTLGMPGSQAARDAVVAALTDTHDAVRAAAARVLGAWGEDAPVDPLIDALHDPSWGVRADAACALGKLGTRVPIEPLVDALNDEDASVSAAAAHALGAQGARAPVDDLLLALHDHAWMVREAALLALGQLGARVPLEPLRAACHDPHEVVREAALMVLRQTHPDGMAETEVRAAPLSSGAADGDAGQVAPPQQDHTTDMDSSTEPRRQSTESPDAGRLGAIVLMRPLNRLAETVFSQIPQVWQDRTEPHPMQEPRSGLFTYIARVPSAPSTSPPPAQRPRRSFPSPSPLLQHPLGVGLTLLGVAVLILTSFAIVHWQRAMTPTENGATAHCQLGVGCVSFLSSNQTSGTPNTDAGLNDEVQIDLHDLPAPAAGKSYYAWLLRDVEHSEGTVFPLGKIPVEQGTVHLLYRGDAHHTNLLAVTSRFLITAEDARISPVNPSPDMGTWLYSSELSQQPDPTDTVNHASLLDHLRHLLSRDPQLDAVGLQGGLAIWLKRNAASLLDLARQAQDASRNGDVVSLRSQLIGILDYLDGHGYVQNDVPPGTPILIDHARAQVALLEFDPVHQQPPGYLYHIQGHLTAIAGSPYATPDQKAEATRLLRVLTVINATLEQVREGVKHLMSMTDAQLLQSASLTTITDVLAHMSRTYNGHADAATQQESIVQVYQDIQQLATFVVRAYQQ